MDCYATALCCPVWAKNRIALHNDVKELQLLSLTVPLESVTIDVLGGLIRAQCVDEYLLDITDTHTTLTERVPMKGVSAVVVLKPILNEWVFNYGPSKKPRADNGGCFTAKVFRTLCKMLNVQNSVTKTYLS